MEWPYTGSQLGILEGRVPIHEKGNTDFLKKIRPLDAVFQIHKRRKYCGMFTDMVRSEAH